MRDNLLKTVVFVSALMASATSASLAGAQTPVPAGALPASNPLATVSPLPFGAPVFDRLKDTDLKPAIEAGMAEDQVESDAIADNPAPPTFENTIVAQEKEGALLSRANVLLSHLVQANASELLDQVNQDEAPRLQAHSDAIMLNTKLFARVKALYDQRETLGLSPSDRFLLELYYRRFVHAGALLAAVDKAKLAALNGQIAGLQAQYQDRLKVAADANAVVVKDRAELDGLSDAEIAVAEAAAKARKLDGRYVIVLRNTTQQPILASLKNRALRARILAASESRGDGPGPADLRDLIASLAQLRAQKAQLLGFPNYGAYVLSMQMAQTPQNARKLLDSLAPAAVAKAKVEAAEIQALIARQNGGFTLTASDWEFYADQVRKAKYDLDDTEVKPYFELNRVLQDGVFFAAHQLYGLTFKERSDLPVYQKDVKVFEVFDTDGQHLALFYVDYFARPNKNGGAWCTYLNNPSGVTGEPPVIVNVANFTKPADGQPALISFDDVTTMFHEFGHALHAMFSVRRYPSQDGFNLPTDVIEFPSQFNEHWALDPTVLAHYARHYQTGAAMPQALVDKIKAAKTYGEGYV